MQTAVTARRAQPFMPIRADDLHHPRDVTLARLMRVRENRLLLLGREVLDDHRLRSTDRAALRKDIARICRCE
jgi:hypothetical protein